MLLTRRLIALIAGVLTISLGSCYLAGWFFGWSSSSHPHRADAHMWIHEHLDISREQDLALADIERRYAQQRDRLLGVIRQANSKLADAILGDRSFSPQVVSAVETIHHAQGELQRVTLEHVFEMQEILTPQQYDKLLELTASSLRHQSDLNRVGYGP